MKSLFCALLFAGVCQATVITSTACSSGNVNGTASSSGIFSCSVESAGGNATANVSASITNTTVTAAESAIATAFSTAIPNSVQRMQGAASGSATVQIALSTAGILRPGFAEIHSTYGGSSGGSSSVAFGPEAFSANGVIPDFCCTPLFPFELGQAFSFNFTSAAGAFTAPMDFLEGANSSANLTLELFESDGVTPVQLIETPEPATFVLLALGSLALFAWKRSRRQMKLGRE